VRNFYPLTQPPNLRITHCRLSATLNSIYSQLPSISVGLSSICNLRTCHAAVTGIRLLDKRHIISLTQRKEKALRKKLRAPTFLHMLQPKFNDSGKNRNLGVNILFSGPAIWLIFCRINAHLTYFYIFRIY